MSTKAEPLTLDPAILAVHAVLSCLPWSETNLFTAAQLLEIWMCAYYRTFINIICLIKEVCQNDRSIGGGQKSSLVHTSSMNCRRRKSSEAIITTTPTPIIKASNWWWECDLGEVSSSVYGWCNVLNMSLGRGLRRFSYISVFHLIRFVWLEMKAQANFLVLLFTSAFIYLWCS